MPNSSGRAMMLAKFSGWPISTQLPSVSRPGQHDRGHGDGHVAHPPQHREQQGGDGDEGQHARLDEGPTTVRPPSRMPIGVPVASGATWLHRVDEAARARRCRWCRPWAMIETRARPSAAIQSRDEVRRQDCQRDRLGGQRRSAIWSSTVFSGGISIASALRAQRRRRLGEPVERGGEAPGVGRGAASGRAGGGAQRRGGRGEARTTSASVGGGAVDDRVEGQIRAAWRRR